MEDDWEYIEILDQELAGIGLEDGDEAAIDGHGSEFGGDADELPFQLHCPTLTKTKCKILSKVDILQLLEDKITRVRSVLPLSRSEAAILLRHFNWSVNRTNDEWLACEEKVRKAVGLFDRHVIETPDEAERACGICNENFPGDTMFGVSCGHQFCHSCWTGYISNAISEGPECLDLQCPGPSCEAAVGLDMIELLSSEEDKKKFKDDLVESYLNVCEKAKWCPAPGCDYAVFLSGGSDDSVVTCRCLYEFCWSCNEEGHSPVDCSTVVKWMAEASAQSENWLLANTWPCPNCRRRIGKNHDDDDCITCDFCDYDFCCDCGDEWSGHGPGDMWNYLCKPDESLRPDGFRDGDERERAIAKKSLERYNHFYERWALDESSEANALAELKLFQNTHLEIMCALLCLSDEKELEFVIEAQLQIVQCYRLLKWTHVYDYFLAKDEYARRRFYDYMEEQAKDLLGRLQKHLTQVKQILYRDVPLKQFMEFRKKLVMLTRVVRSYFDKMGEAVKTGLPEVVSIPRPISKVMGDHTNIASTSSQRPTLDVDSLLAQIDVYHIVETNDSGMNLHQQPDWQGNGRE